MMNECNNNQTTPEKKKLSLDQHLDGTGDNITNDLKGGSLDRFIEENNIDLRNNDNVTNDYKNSLDRFIDENNIDLTNSDQKHTLPKLYKDSAIEITKDDFIRLSKQNDGLAIDIDEPLEEIEYLLKDQCGVGTLPLGNLSMIVAPPKNAKSTTVGIFVAAILGYAKNYYLYAQKESATVLHIDTEQAREDQKRGFRYIIGTCEMNGMSKKDFSKSYRPLHLRTITGAELQKSVIVDIIRFRPTFVILDGVVQMQKDILDQADSAKLVATLLSVCETYNCNIMCVIHTPKLKYNEKDMSVFLPKGATGTWLNQAVADCFVCVCANPDFPEEDRYFLCRHVMSRHRHITDLKFYRDIKTGMPHPYFETSMPKDEERVSNAILKILSERGNKGIPKGELIKLLEKELRKGFKRATLENKWDTLTAPISDRLLTIPQGASKLIKLKDPNDPEQMEFNVMAEPDQPTEEAPF